MQCNHPEVDRIWGMCGICAGSFEDDILFAPGWLQASAFPRAPPGPEGTSSSWF